MRVLLTGGNGFVASHILDALLENNFHVFVTVRSAGKGSQIIDAYPGISRDHLAFVVVEDIAKDCSFDEAIKIAAPLDYVVHAASPFHFNIKDAIKDFHKPAVEGTVGLLRSISAHAPSVKRVVLTSSFATIVNPRNHAKVYDESFWAPMTAEEAIQPRWVYPASKILAERAAWDFMSNNKPPFDLVSIHPPMIYGPVPRFLNGLDSINTSNRRILDIVTGEIKKSGMPPTGVFMFADVRDVALAHVRALQVPEAGGERFLVANGHYSNRMLVDIILRNFASLAGRLPGEGDFVDDMPSDVYDFDSKKSRDILGLKYRSLEDCATDTVTSLLSLGAHASGDNVDRG